MDGRRGICQPLYVADLGGVAGACGCGTSAAQAPEPRACAVGSIAGLGTVARSELAWGRRCAMSTPTLESVVRVDPEVLGGTPVFAGTRVPIKNLVDYLAAGDPLERFLSHFPSVTREQAVAVLEIAGDLLASRAHPAR